MKRVRQGAELSGEESSGEKTPKRVMGPQGGSRERETGSGKSAPTWTRRGAGKGRRRGEAGEGNKSQGRSDREWGPGEKREETRAPTQPRGATRSVEAKSEHAPSDAVTGRWQGRACANGQRMPAGRFRAGCWGVGGQSCPGSRILCPTGHAPQSIRTIWKGKTGRGERGASLNSKRYWLACEAGKRRGR